MQYNFFLPLLKFGLSEKHPKFEKICLMVLTNQLIYVCFSKSPNFKYQYIWSVKNSNIKSISKSDRYGISLPKLFWPTVRKNCSSDQEKLLKFFSNLFLEVSQTEFLEQLEFKLEKNVGI